MSNEASRQKTPQLTRKSELDRALGCHRCALVPQGGSGSNAKSKAILEALDLPVKIVTDMDYAFGQAIKKGWVDGESEDVKKCFSYFKELEENKEIKLQNDRPDRHHTKKGYNALYENENTRVALTNIHEALLKHGIWVWKRGVIESHLGIEDKDKDEEAWQALLDNVEKTDFNSAIKEDYEEVAKMLNWLKEPSVDYN